MRGESVRAVPMHADGVSAVRVPLLLLFGAVLIVLLIAATNVASLLLARGLRREREMAIRSAIGASRWDAMRPVLAESLVIACLGGALGIALAILGVRTIGTLASIRLPQLAGLTVDVRIVAFALVLSVLVAALCGCVPAWRATTVDPQDALRGGRGGGVSRGDKRALSALVIVEVALSLALLIGAGLILKGFTSLIQSNPGFAPAPLLALEVGISPPVYPDVAPVTRFLVPALEAIARGAAVAAAGAVSALPYDNWGNTTNIRYEGQETESLSKLPVVEARVATPGFFDVTRQRLVSGRALRASDEGPPNSQEVAVVNQALVTRDFAGKDPVGKRFHTSDTAFATIVGVVTDIRNAGPTTPPQPELYTTYKEAARGNYWFALAVRVRSGEPLAVAKAVQGAIQSVDRGAAVSHVRPMTEVISRSIGGPRFLLSLMAVSRRRRRHLGRCRPVRRHELCRGTARA